MNHTSECFPATTCTIHSLFHNTSDVHIIGGVGWINNEWRSLIIKLPYFILCIVTFPVYTALHACDIKSLDISYILAYAIVGSVTSFINCCFIAPSDTVTRNGVAPTIVVKELLYTSKMVTNTSPLEYGNYSYICCELCVQFS